MPLEHLYPEHDSTRIAVPSAVFVSGPQPPFVLFDRRGRIADGSIARTVYVAPSDAAALDEFLGQRAQAIVASRQTPAGARAWVLHHLLLVEATRGLERLPEQPNALQPVMRVLHLLAEQLPAEAGPYLAVAAQDGGGPASHAVSTALYAMALAAAEGMDDRDSLVAFGAAGVFADLALRRMPADVLERTDALSEDDWALVHAHAHQSSDLLTRAGVRSPATLRAIRAHHERWDGSGYPDGASGVAIPIEGRILGIADTYTAMTEERPHRAARRGYEVLLEMAQTSGAFEPRLLRAFVRVLGQALSTGATWTPAAERDPRRAGEAA